MHPHILKAIRNEGGSYAVTSAMLRMLRNCGLISPDVEDEAYALIGGILAVYLEAQGYETDGEACDHALLEAGLGELRRWRTDWAEDNATADKIARLDAHIRANLARG